MGRVDTYQAEFLLGNGYYKVLGIQCRPFLPDADWIGQFK